MPSSSLGFGVLLLLRAVLAQSAPHIYPDEDEEALIDKLASLAAASRPDLFNNKEIFSNFDISQLDYLHGLHGSSEPKTLIGSAEVAGVEDLPRKFGYTPDDVRFYIPADQFPNYQSGSAQNVNVKSEDRGSGKNLRQYEPEDLNQMSNDIIASTGDGTPKEPPFMVDHAPHMKKSDADVDKDNFQSNPDPQHSHIMLSSNSAEHLGDPALTHLVEKSPFSFYYIAMIAGGSAAGVVAIIAAGICWYRINERVKAAAEVDYPAYGVTGPSKDVSPSPSGGDRKLAQSAHMYHYQHQKQQMAALQKQAIQGERPGCGGSDVESEEDDEEGDYTVYECPGLAPAGDMEVKNPQFEDEPTPATPQPAIAAKTDDPTIIDQAHLNSGMPKAYSQV